MITKIDKSTRVYAVRIPEADFAPIDIPWPANTHVDWLRSIHPTTRVQVYLRSHGHRLGPAERILICPTKGTACLLISSVLTRWRSQLFVCQSDYAYPRKPWQCKRTRWNKETKSYDVFSEETLIIDHEAYNLKQQERYRQVFGRASPEGCWTREGVDPDFIPERIRRMLPSLIDGEQAYVALRNLKASSKPEKEYSWRNNQLRSMTG